MFIVKKLQEDLVSLGYGVNGIDGYFGSNTETAVRKFQQDHKLTVDGVAGQNTKNAIVNEIASTTGRKLGNDGVPIDIMNKINTGSTGYSTPSTATSYTQSNLSKSMVGVYSDEVKKLQEDLVSLGYGVNGIDGHFGDKTDAAVRKFQQDHKLTVDGVAGQNTKNAIINEIASMTGRKLGNNGVPLDLIKTEPITPSVVTGYTENNLSKKMIGVYSNEVKKLQEDLTSLKYSTNGIDGYFGNNTEAAVRKFQQDHKLVVDGVAGKDTKLAISNALVSSTGPVINSQVNNGISDGERPALSLVSVDYNRLDTSTRRDLDGLIEHLNMEDGEVWYMPSGVGHLRLDRDMVESFLTKQIEFINSDFGSAVCEFSFRSEKVVNGVLQAVGGFTEVVAGYSIFGAASATVVGIPIGIAGVYLGVDGVSNVTGGVSKVIHGLRGDLEDDTANFVKSFYKSCVPNGENVYNYTQIAICLLTIGKGIVELPSDAYKIFTRPQNILRAEQQALKTETVIMDVGNKVVVTTRELDLTTKTPMILQRVIIDKSKLTEGVLSIGLDNYNVNSAYNSIK